MQEAERFTKKLSSTSHNDAKHAAFLLQIHHHVVFLFIHFGVGSLSIFQPFYVIDIDVSFYIDQYRKR